MYDGSDTAYYLHRGFRVVAIEANPQLADAARLTICGTPRLWPVASPEHRNPPNPGLDLPFWISEMATCSSFSEGVATKFGRATPTTVRTESFSRVLADHGVPRYLKIDIETLDDACIAALDRRDLPQYVSIEAQPNGPETSLVELSRLGYRKFKIIEQGEFQPLVRYRISRKHRLAYFLPRLRDRLVLSDAPPSGRLELHTSFKRTAAVGNSRGIGNRLPSFRKTGSVGYRLLMIQLRTPKRRISPGGTSMHRFDKHPF